MPHLVVLVPGIMGSELRRGTELVWPGPLHSLLLPYRQMDALTSDDLVATDVIRTYSISTQYQALIDDLITCGFREKSDPPTLFVCPYDWRKANERAAETLADRLDAAVDRHKGDAQMSLVAHSMGGLVSRHYLESGRFKGRPGFRAVRRLITLATPHRGAAVALPRLLGQEKVLWLNKEQVRQVVSDQRFPGAYQLLPSAGEPFAWDDAPGAEYGGFDVYGCAADLGLSAANLEAARAFHATLDCARRPEGVRYFCFGGTRQKTATLVRIARTGTPYVVRKLELDGGGDGTVPVWSSLLPGIQGMPVGGEHSTIYKTRDLRRTLAVLLGAPPRVVESFEPTATEVEVALRERVAEPGRVVRLALTFERGTKELNSELRVERVDEAAASGTPQPAPLSAAYPVHYSGLAAETLGLLIEAPGAPGLYRIAYYPAGQPAPAGADELFVQQPG
jgi:pimeloyl-ACP methyl ester carboxylesterase